MVYEKMKKLSTILEKRMTLGKDVMYRKKIVQSSSSGEFRFLPFAIGRGDGGQGGITEGRVGV